MFQKFPHHSTFSFSPVVDFLGRNAFNWLGNLFFLGWYELVGLGGLQFLRILATLFSVLLIHSLTNYRLNLSLLLIFVIFIYGLHQKLTIRTSLFAIPFFSLLIWIWINKLENKNMKLLYAIPPLMVLWSNLHGSYLIGFFVLLLLVIGRWLDTFVRSGFKLKSYVRLLLILSLTIGGIVLVKPFPDRLIFQRSGEIIFKVSSTIQSKPTVTTASTGWTFEDFRDLLVSDRPGQSEEFSSTLNRTQFLFVWLTILFIPIGVGLFFLGPTRFSLTYLFGLIGCLVLSLAFLRGTAYLPLFVLPHLIIQPFLYRFQSGWIINSVVLILLSTIGGIALATIITGSSNRLTGFHSQRIGLGALPRFSGELPEHILRNYPNKRFFNTYALGGFLIWKWWPHKKIFVDSKSSAYRDSFRRTRAKKPIMFLLEKYNLDYALIMRDRPNQVQFFHENESWELFAMDRGTVAYHRKMNNNS